MPLPLIIAGVAIAAAGYGVKKGFDAKEDFDEAEELNDDAERILEDAQDSLDTCRQETQSELEALGREKAQLFERALIPFVDTFGRIKNVEFDKKDLPDATLGDIEQEVLQVNETSVQMAEVLQGGVSALSSGALAGLATYGSVGLLGTASTGTAIAGLSGAAAHSATLAWLGGGALAAGGMGMAGGMAVLGGIVAAPVLLVGGFVLSSKAEEALENARSNHLLAEGHAEDMQTAEVAAEAIARKSAEVRKVVRRLRDRMLRDLPHLRDLVDRTDDYRRYSGMEKQFVYRIASLAVTAKNVAEAPLLDDDGTITGEIRKVLRKSKAFIKKLGEM